MFKHNLSIKYTYLLIWTDGPRKGKKEERIDRKNYIKINPQASI